MISLGYWGLAQLGRVGGDGFTLSLSLPPICPGQNQNPQKGKLYHCVTPTYTPPAYLDRLDRLDKTRSLRPRPSPLGGSCIAFRFEVPYAAVVARVAKPDDTGTIKVLFGLGHE